MTASLPFHILNLNQNDVPGTNGLVLELEEKTLYGIVEIKYPKILYRE